MSQGVCSKLNRDRFLEKHRKLVAKFIEQHVGIQLPENKRALIESRLRKRQRLLDFDSLPEYIEYAFSANNKHERVNLIDAITTNTTRFYREPKHFEFLKKNIINGLRKSKPWGVNRPFRIWSAGCSTGEEPYTIALELLEIRRNAPQFHFEIWATDISSRCLSTAKNGIYPFKSSESLPLEIRNRYFYRSKDPQQLQIAISTEVMKYVRFSKFNLLSDQLKSENHFDIVFCRNVLIYFNSDDKEKISKKFYNALNSGGFLILGHSESLLHCQKQFIRLEPTIYSKT